LFQLFDGVQVIAAGALRGYRDTAVPMLIAAIGYWAMYEPCLSAIRKRVARRRLQSPTVLTCISTKRFELGVTKRVTP